MRFLRPVAPSASFRALTQQVVAGMEMGSKRDDNKIASGIGTAKDSMMGGRFPKREAARWKCRPIIYPLE